MILALLSVASVLVAYRVMLTARRRTRVTRRRAPPRVELSCNGSVHDVSVDKFRGEGYLTDVQLWPVESDRTVLLRVEFQLGTWESFRR